MTIQIPKKCRGESLAIGTFIAGPDGDGSQIKVVDPILEKPLKIRKSQLNNALQAVERGMFAKQLRTEGFPNAAAALAFPSRRRNLEEKDRYSEKPSVFEERIEFGRSELTSITDRTFQFDKVQFVGSQITLPLPKPVLVDGSRYNSVKVRRGIAREKFENIRKKENFLNVDFEDISARMPIRFTQQGTTASAEFGHEFVSSITLQNH